MKQSVIPGISLRANETLTMVPGQLGWVFTLKVYTVQFDDVLEAKYFLSDESASIARHVTSTLRYMMMQMRRNIEQEVLRRVLG